MTAQAACWAQLLLLLLCRLPALGQTPTNVDIYLDQAVSCLHSVPGPAQAFTLQSPGVMEYLETALISGWTSAGKSVFRADSAVTRPLPHLAYRTETATVAYAPARRKRLARTVSLTLLFSWTTEDGRILRSERCNRSSEDTILRREVADLETPSYPETTGTLPPSGWTRRYLEPAALGAATVLMVFLFFNLRSSRAPAGG